MKDRLPERQNPLFKTIREFHFNGQIGNGAFSTVFEVTHLPTNARYSIKQVKLGELDDYSIQNIRKELEIHQGLDHPNIVKLHDFLVEQEVLYMVLALCPNGNLFRHINALIRIPEPEIRRIFFQVCQAIDYLHRRDIILRDIKPENILLDAARNVKVCDFGWATHVGRTTYNRARAGTYAYMSPEALAAEYQTPKSDIWALGVLLFELHYNSEPYDAKDVYSQAKAIKETAPAFDERIVADARQLIESCLQKEPNDRPEIGALLAHPFFASSRSQTAARETINPPRANVRRNSAEKKARAGSIVAPSAANRANNAFGAEKALPSYSTDRRVVHRIDKSVALYGPASPARKPAIVSTKTIEVAPPTPSQTPSVLRSMSATLLARDESNASRASVAEAKMSLAVRQRSEADSQRTIPTPARPAHGEYNIYKHSVRATVPVGESRPNSVTRFTLLSAQAKSGAVSSQGVRTGSATAPAGSERRLIFPSRPPAQSVASGSPAPRMLYPERKSGNSSKTLSSAQKFPPKTTITTRATDPSWSVYATGPTPRTPNGAMGAKPIALERKAEVSRVLASPKLRRDSSKQEKGEAFMLYQPAQPSKGSQLLYGPRRPTEHLYRDAAAPSPAQPQSARTRAGLSPSSANGLAKRFQISRATPEPIARGRPPSERDGKVLFDQKLLNLNPLSFAGAPKPAK